MSLVISQDVLDAAHLSADELRLEVAVMLYAAERLTLAQAARLAGMTRMQFQHVLGSRQVAVHYDAEDLREDLETLRSLPPAP